MNPYIGRNLYNLCFQQDEALEGLSENINRALTKEEKLRSSTSP